jgi:hypothetical protein
MQEQIAFIEQRDGKELAIEYAQRVLKAYRNAARYRNREMPRVRHHAHFMPYRPHFVRSIIYIRNYLRANI